MINNVVLVGRLTKDPELKMTPSGIAVARFTLAVNRPFTGQSGEKKADFINCIAWRKQAENLANFMRKGGQIGVCGRIETGSYEGQDGKRVYTTDIIADSIQFLESKSGANGENAPKQNKAEHQEPQYYNQRPPAPQQQPTFPPSVPSYTPISEDDLPF